jgi:hypothetical protein
VQNSSPEATGRGARGAQKAKLQTIGFRLTNAAAGVKFSEATPLLMSAIAAKAKKCLFMLH